MRKRFNLKLPPFCYELFPLSDLVFFVDASPLLPQLLSETFPVPARSIRDGLFDDVLSRNFVGTSELPPLVPLLIDEIEDVSLFFGFVIVFLTIGTIIGGDLTVADTDAVGGMANGDGDLDGDI